MKFVESPLKGAYIIKIDKKVDERGFFARLFCQNEFSEIGLSTDFKQINSSFTALKSTIRGLHYQLMPKSEVKVVRCISGALFDVILDLRPDSPNFGQWFGQTLSSENRTMMYVPRGFAHGFLSLTDNTEVIYFASEVYDPRHEKGVRYDDLKFKIEWPIEVVNISYKDANLQNFDSKWHGVHLLKGLI